MCCTETSSLCLNEWGAETAAWGAFLPSVAAVSDLKSCRVTADVYWFKVAEIVRNIWGWEEKNEKYQERIFSSSESWWSDDLKLKLKLSIFFFLKGVKLHLTRWLSSWNGVARWWWQFINRHPYATCHIALNHKLYLTGEAEGSTSFLAGFLFSCCHNQFSHAFLYSYESRKSQLLTWPHL